METNRIIEASKKVVTDIYEQIGVIEGCNVMLATLDSSKISLLDDEGVLASLEPALSMEQQAEVMYSIRQLLKGNIHQAELKLQELSGMSKPTEAVLQDTVSIPEELGNPEPITMEPPKVTAPDDAEKKVKYIPKSKMDADLVRQMLKDGYSVKDIQEYYGYKCEQTVYNFIRDNKISVKNCTAGNDTAKQLTEQDIPQIQALYTKGPFNLRDTAAEIGTTKKILHEFLQKYPHLVKPER